MKKNFLLLLIVNFTLLKFGIAQIPQNLIPNHSFENGPGSPGYKRILGQIDNWDEAYPSTVYSNFQKQFGGQDDKYSTLWLGWENVDGNYFFADKRNYPVPTSRFIEVRDGVKTKLKDGSSLKKISLIYCDGKYEWEELRFLKANKNIILMYILLKIMIGEMIVVEMDI